MLILLLLAQLQPPVTDSAVGPAGQVASPTYSTPALRALVAEVAEANRSLPPGFGGHTANVESEVALIFLDSLGRERVVHTEQLASRLSWSRDGRQHMHIVGDRSVSVAPVDAVMQPIIPPIFPLLYGERFGGDIGASRQPSGARVVAGAWRHPLAANRDLHYRYSGGDTTGVIHVDGRAIPIVTVRVSPSNVERNDSRILLFDGEVQLDATRQHIVRMRGRLVDRVPEKRGLTRLADQVIAMEVPTYIEFVSSEQVGQFWIPTRQRFEVQLGSALMGQTRVLLRTQSRFHDTRVIAPDDPALAALSTVGAGTTWAPPDSLERFADWRLAVGEMTGSVDGADFDDVAPRRWRSDGSPRVTLYPTNRGRTLRFNRVEGLFTGLELSVDFRDAAPGLTTELFGGWAWTQRTVRGGAAASYRTGESAVGARAERALVSTNDFPGTMWGSTWDLTSGDPGFGSLSVAMDDRDYIDRSIVGAWASREMSGPLRGTMAIQLQAGRDRSEEERTLHGLFSRRPSFRPNRSAADGEYVRLALDYSASGEKTGWSARPGLGAQLHHEIARGGLSWQRSEGVLAARSSLGPVRLAARLNAGAVFGSEIPPQQLFELGGYETLPGYDYKAFTGDRAALLRVYSSVPLPILQRPVWYEGWRIPAPGPAIGFGVQAGWSELSTVAARAAAERLTSAWATPLVPSGTDGVRGTIGGGLTFVGGLFTVGASRALERGARWRWGFGAELIF